MLIDQINLNHIRIFESVYRSGSMTLAADELSLTQSGVSQHIKSLEDVLNVRLFDRINQRLVPTAQASLLYDKCAHGLQEIEGALAHVTGRDHELSGTVSIGMPIEFGNNVLIPLLTKFARANPYVKYKLRLGFASEMNDALLRGDLDFAFVDAFTMDRRITTETVYDETLELCIHPDLIKDKLSTKQNRAFFEALPYIEYQIGEPVLRMWFAHHLKTKHLALNVRTFVMDVQGVANFIQSGMGAGILPSHYVSRLERNGGRVYLFKGCGRPMHNSISVAYLEQRSHAQATLALLESLKVWLKDDKKN